MVDRQMVHVPDLAAEVDSEFPVIKDYQQLSAIGLVLQCRYFGRDCRSARF